MARTDLDIIRGARELFVKEKRGHSKQAPGRNGETKILFDLESAPQLSITGALMLSCRRLGLAWAIAFDAVDRCAKALHLRNPGNAYHDLANWNDHEDTTRDRVIVVLSRALGMQPRPVFADETRPPPPPPEPEPVIVGRTAAANDGDALELLPPPPPILERPEDFELDLRAVPPPADTLKKRVAEAIREHKKKTRELPELPDLPELPE